MVLPPETIQLGQTGIRISELGLGTWSWGDRIFWAYGQTHIEKDVEEAFLTNIEAGINFIDTAPIYGSGRSEEMLGSLLKKTPKDLIVATKYVPYPWKMSKNSLIHALKASLKRLGRAFIDLYMIHYPLPPIPIERWMEMMAEAHKEGLVRAIGVSNFNEEKMLLAQKALNKHGLFLAANQIHYSLLRRRPEALGLLDRCRKEGITFIAYSPLGQGLLTGKYTPDRPLPKGFMRLGNRRIIREMQPLIKRMRQIGEAHGSKTPAQVAINWVMCKGAVPLVGAKNQLQASENLGALGWKLSEEEIALLDEACTSTQLSFPMETFVGL